MNYPDHWTTASLGEVTEIVTGSTPSTDDDSNFGDDHLWITPTDLTSNEGKYISSSDRKLSETGLNSCSATLFPKGTVILASRATIGTVAIASTEACTNQGCKSFIPSNELLSDFLYYYIQSIEKRILDVSSGTTYDELSKKQAAELEIAFPSIDEQERIVAKIEELFSKLDSGVSELEKSKERLEFYNRAVLKAAMEGKFTKKARQLIPKTGGDYLENILEYRREKWDDEFQEVFKYSGKEYEEPGSTEPPEYAKIPDEWTWGTVNHISYVVGGLTKNNSKREDYSTEVPYLRVANVYADELYLDDIKTIKISEREKKTKMLHEGDLLVVEGNGSKSQIGRVALWDGSISPCSHQNHLIKVRILKEALRKFALYWLLSPMGRNAIVDVASSTSGLHTLSISKVRSIPVPIPPEEEAEKVVQEIERRTTVTDQVLNDVENELSRTGRLRQSILKHAFEGNLVPQDPTKEPPTPAGGDANLEPGEQTTLSEVTTDVE